MAISVENIKLKVTLPMAIMDALPVLCFSVAMLLIAQLYGSALFLLGAVLCTLAGAGKVAWKLLLAVSGRNVPLLFRQFRVMMPGGGVLMLLSLAVDRPSLSVIGRNVLSFPCNILFAVAVVCMLLMGVCAVKLDAGSVKANWLEQSINLIAQLCILLAVVIIWYCADYYRTDTSAFEGSDLYSTVEVTELDGGLLFDGPGESTALIFYPGAKVEYTAYTPILLRLADAGVDCFLLEMPYNLAVLGINAADDILSDYTYESWYIGGHSMGGAMAAVYAAGHTDELAGLLLLAAYPTSDLGDLPVLSIYGDLDGVVNAEKLATASQYTSNLTEVAITGGNHAQFGSYGLQSGDSTALITPEEQWELTVSAVLEWMGD